MRNNKESQEQEVVINWCKLQSCKHKELDLIYHIPNGGKRNVREAASLKRQGVRAGIPDLHLPVARNGYHSLYIELKVGRNKCSENQNKWISRLSEQGHKVNVCYGSLNAIETIKEYLGI